MQKKNNHQFVEFARKRLAEADQEEQEPKKAKHEGGEDHTNPDKKCVVCLTRGVECAFVPCGHLVACAVCSANVRDVCPICRAPIAMAMKVYT